MKDRDCESCKKFSRGDPHESEGYCEAKRTWVDPQEGEDCKMHEFTLWTADKYKDGTPIMFEPKVDISSSYPEAKAAKNSLYGKYASNQLDDEVPEGFHRTPFGLMPNCLFHPDNDYLKEDASREQIIEFANATADDVEQLKDFIYNDEDPEGYSHYKLVKETAQRVFDLNIKLENYVEEYDAVLKTHGDTLEQHLERIEDLDDILVTHAGKINNHTDALLDHEHKLSTLSADVEEHLDRICELENDYANIIEDLRIMKERLCKITSLITDSDKYAHIFENFCGNCTHSQTTDGICICELSGEIIDPDSASCSMFGPPF